MRGDAHSFMKNYKRTRKALVRKKKSIVAVQRVQLPLETFPKLFL